MKPLSAGTVAKLIGAVLSLSLIVVGLHMRQGPKPMLVTASFSRAGLNVRPGYEVRVRDVPVGTIKAIKIDRRDFSATYVLAIKPGEAIAADTTAQLVPKTVFGDKYVELEPAAPGQPLLQNGAVIGRDRTKPSTEVQQVMDRAVPLLEALDPPRFGASLASLSEGLGSTGDDLAHATSGWTTALQELSAHSGDIQALLDHVPGVAGTFAARADDLAAAADGLGRVADVLAKDEPQLAEALKDAAAMSTRVADLLADRPGRLGRIVPDMIDVVRLTAAQPGQIAMLAKYLQSNIRGTASIYKGGFVRIRESATVIMNPGTLIDAPPGYDETHGGTGVFPDVYVHGLPTNKNVGVGVGALMAPLTGGPGQ